MSLYGAQRYGLSFTLQCFPEKIFAKRRKDKSFSLVIKAKTLSLPVDSNERHYEQEIPDRHTEL